MPISLDHTLPLFHSLGRQRCHDLCRFLLHLASRGVGRYFFPMCICAKRLGDPCIRRCADRRTFHCQMSIRREPRGVFLIILHALDHIIPCGTALPLSTCFGAERGMDKKKQIARLSTLGLWARIAT